MNPEQQSHIPPVDYHITEDPGKTMGIVGFVLSFIVSIAGLIVSIIALRKSRAARRSNPLAIAGIVISSVFILLWLAIVPLITIVAYQGISARANTTSAQAAASTVAKKSYAYWAETEKYPTATSDFDDPDEVYYLQGITFSSQPLVAQPSDANTVTFYTCGEAGNKVEYWNYTTSEPVAVYVGEADVTSTCSLVN